MMLDGKAYSEQADATDRSHFLSGNADIGTGIES
jgi:hypothetical protein